MKELSPYSWEYLGAPDASLADDLITKDIKKHGTPRLVLTGYESPQARFNREKWDEIINHYFDTENPDIDDSHLTSVMQSVEQLQETPPEVITAEEHYQQLLAIEREERKARRERLRLKRLKREQEEKNNEKNRDSDN